MVYSLEKLKLKRNDCIKSFRSHNGLFENVYYCRRDILPKSRHFRETPKRISLFFRYSGTLSWNECKSVNLSVLPTNNVLACFTVKHLPFGQALKAERNKQTKTITNWLSNEIIHNATILSYLQNLCNLYTWQISLLSRQISRAFLDWLRILQ